MTDKNLKVRESGPDLIRTIACIFVVGLHFYLNIGYYDAPLTGVKMYFMTGARWLFMTAVPLFFMLTGYFKCHKKMDGAHYRALIPLLISYLVISVAKMLLYNRIFGKIYGIREMLENLANYQIAWYMGIYLCLFLLIPFINRGWEALDRKEQDILLITLTGLCTLYPVFKYIGPSYFTGLYPVLFYLLGAAVRQRRPKVSKAAATAVLFGVVILETFISVRFTSTGTFDWNLISTVDGAYGSFFVMICTVCVFVLFYDTGVKGRAVRAFLSSVSSVSFEIYLFSGAYDALIYAYVKRYIKEPSEAFWYFFVTVPLSFIAAYVSSLIFRYCVSKILKLSGLSAKS